MKLVVEILTGNLFYVQVEDDATIDGLKKEIEAQENLARERMILIVDSKDENQLITKEDDGASLADFGVQDGSHIYLFFNPLNIESPYYHLFTLPETLLG
ncbi:hypothetical protein ERO13_A11G161900v2 [Gossypium hirsutum]|uniref:Ubiquitin-like domain-containing protein n=1 Tax=Gossypium tomentosum TaxID=34277 RepID=A0A5D2NDH4_GOSTO|nr:hypothetical protein ERO13_A11G161900v2 [Gossypium hirsutum]TYI01175.1 hypothetical protein ES332_A11G183700v1 [Gossypium tomentosum]